LQFQSKAACAIVQHRYGTSAAIDCLWGEIPERPVAKEQEWYFALAFAVNKITGFFWIWCREDLGSKSRRRANAYLIYFPILALFGSSHCKHRFKCGYEKAALSVGRNNHQLNGHTEKLRRIYSFCPMIFLDRGKNN
jgi:hypothetical protein